MRNLCLLFLVLLLVSCKTLNPTTLHNVVDTIVLRDSIYIREFIKGDTVFRDRVAYRDRWRTHLVHDTVVKTDSIVQVIEHPPERYIPRFHRTCTTLFCLLLIGCFVKFCLF